MSAYKEQLSGAGLTEKWLMKEGKVQIRLHAVKTRANLVSAGVDRPPDIELLQQKISGLVQMQPGALLCFIFLQHQPSALPTQSRHPMNRSSSSTCGIVFRRDALA